MICSYYWPALQPPWWSRHSQSITDETESSQCPESILIMSKYAFLIIFQAEPHDWNLEHDFTCQVTLRSLTSLAEKRKSKAEDVSPVARPSSRGGDAEVKTWHIQNLSRKYIIATFIQSWQSRSLSWRFIIHSPLSHSPKHPHLLWPPFPAIALNRHHIKTWPTTQNVEKNLQ